jgi:hypothetical protein
MIFTRRFLASLLLCAALAACSVPEAPGDPNAAEEATATGTLEKVPGTPTIDWFPATPTLTPPPFATHTATPEMHPGVGQTTLSDSFTDEELWDTTTSDKGSANIDRNRLTLAVQPKVYMISLRHKLALNDFYAEITARPNLCRGDDDYGLLVRANAVAYYRFALSCNGMVKAERISVGTRQPLQEAVLSGDAPRGSPGEVRIGVWAVGTEMRLFLNGRYQFTVRNPNYRSGTIGVFARAAGDTPVTINFSDLVIQEVDYAPPPATLTPEG